MALLGKTENLNGSFKCVAYVDIDSSEDAAPTYDIVKAWKDANSYTDKWMYPLWPKAVIADRVYYLSALAAALTAQTDSGNNGVPALSPSNKGLRITGLVNEAGDEVTLDQTQANLVNDAGVATAVNIGGWKLWGNKTGAYPENRDPKDFWLNYRRLFAWDSNNTVLTFIGSIDQPISERLKQTVANTKNIQGNGYVAAGNLAAYRCDYIPDENPITDIISGIVKFHLSISPYPPAETIIFTQEFDPAALDAALNGGDS
jgi:phage tail sheath protein FI